MKKLLSVLMASLMTAGLAMSVSAGWYLEDDFCEVEFNINKQTAEWAADGVINEGEYTEVVLKDSWMSFALNDDANLDAAHNLKPKLYMSWDEKYIYMASTYSVENHDNDWDSDPGSMWQSGSMQISLAEYDEQAPDYRLEYGVGRSSTTDEMLYTVWADGAYLEYQPSEADQVMWVNNGQDIIVETRTPFSAFYEDFTPEAGRGFNFNIVWSIGQGTDYVHVQLASGCTGNGKHADYFARVSLATETGEVPVIEEPVVEETPVEAPIEEAPAEAPVEEAPAETPAETPTEAPTEEAPAETTAPETTEAPAAESSSNTGVIIGVVVAAVVVAVIAGVVVAKKKK